MKEQKKIYMAPTAELILLAPVEALAEGTNDDAMAFQQWGVGTGVSETTASTVQGTYSGYWNEDGTITQSTGGN